MNHCDRCTYDTHMCPGCGAPLSHGIGVCSTCDKDDACGEG